MASWLFYIAVFLKQFYIFPSGNLGIADLFFAAACVMTFYGAWKNRTKLFYREDIPWVIFLIFVAIINGIYFIRTSNREFPLHTMYWIYSACLIWMFRTLYSDGLCVVCAGFAASIWYFSCLFCSLGVGVISMNPGVVPGLWEPSMIRTSLHFLSLP